MAMPLDQYQRVIVAQLRASPVKSVVLFVGLGVLIFLVIRQATGGAEQADAEGVQEGAIDPADVARQAEKKRRPVPDITATIHRDPFAFDWIAGAGQINLASETENQNEDGSNLQLQSTITAEGIAPSAVINGIIVREGAHVEGYVVERIGDRIVVLRRGGHRRTLTMP